MLQICEPVTYCDQFSEFPITEAKHESFREPIRIAFDRLIQSFGWNSV